MKTDEINAAIAENAGIVSRDQHGKLYHTEDGYVRETPQITTTLPQIRVYFKPPSHCCQKCGENIGWIGRFLFGWAHRCEAPDSQNAKGQR